MTSLGVSSTASLFESGLHLFLEAAPDAMICVDGNGRIVFLNGQTEQLFGYARDELVGQPVEILVPERFRHVHRERGAGYLGDPRSRPMGAGLDLYALRKDGTEFPAEISLAPIRDRGGHARDRRDPRRQRAQARRRQVPRAAGGRARRDGHREPLRQHRAGQRADREAVRLHPRKSCWARPSRCSSPSGSATATPGIAPATSATRSCARWARASSCSALRKDGSEFPIEISLSPLETEEGMLVSSAIRDITERKKAEEKFRGLLESAPDAMVIVEQRRPHRPRQRRRPSKLFGYHARRAGRAVGRDAGAGALSRSSTSAASQRLLHGPEGARHGLGPASSTGCARTAPSSRSRSA